MKFSIIVPVYDVEKYLDECVRSILSQTYTDFELILVDDKSPDNSPAMCDAYAKEDSRIRVLHKPINEGLGFARNSGMDLAQGEYVLFVDSDDTIAAEALASYAEAVKDNPDVVASGLTLCFENKKGETIRREELKPQAFDSGNTAQGKADVFAMLTENRVFQYACTKAYKRELLLSTNVRFEKTKLIEDYLFNMEVFTSAKRICALDASFYFYRKPKHETLASKYSPEFFELSKRRYRLAKNYLEAFDKDEKYADLFRVDYVKHCVSAVVRNHSKSANLTKREQKRFVLELLEDPLTVETVRDFAPQGFVYKFLKRIMLKKKVGTFYFFCTTVAAIRGF